MTSLDADIEASPDVALDGEILREPGIGMQKQQHVSGRLAGPGVHLHGAAARGDDDAVAEAGGELARGILAAAVDDDHFMTATAQRRERLQRGADARRLVQRRDDDRESFSAQS